ncbi:TetR family transcriptional regulator [Paenibacillus sp. HJL G12]|uniref:TetR family transcriptional regulator n=1 Tax=Paenibacillus dendrobii TaxID=2691084 RepID=A0A7X3IMP8_9BACL|nr:TetR/AcrR family transcriptional regulator [Paenibacillus dendrobii]MWV46803.1 TetR family transcriptional regulator [Paenibacillus dendrobii]
MTSDRKQEIMDAAIHIFSRKGFNGSTMQDIAEGCGMSKATLYQHYKSKDQLLLSIFHMINDRLYVKLQASMNQVHTTSADSLRDQIELQLQDSLAHRDLIRMLITENPNSYNEEVLKASGAMRGRMIRHYEKMFHTVYGPRIEPYAVDLVYSLLALLEQYSGLVILENAAISMKELSYYILKMLDYMAEGLMKEEGLKPILGEHNYPEYLRCDITEPETDSVEGLICRMYRRADSLSKSGKEEQDVRDSILLLDQELKSPTPRRFIVQGMLLNLQQIEELAGLAGRLASMPQIKSYLN